MNISQHLKKLEEIICIKIPMWGYDTSNNIKFTTYLMMISMNIYGYKYPSVPSKSISIVFLCYLYHYPYNIVLDFDIIKQIINSNINNIVDFKDYKKWNDEIIKHFSLSNDSLTDNDGYSAYSYSLIHNNNNIYTQDTIDSLINYNYIPTYKDKNLMQLLMYNYIYNIIIKKIDFFICFDLITDIKSTICYFLSQIVLFEQAPIYFNIYNKVIDLVNIIIIVK